MTARRAEGPGDSLELLLDTITNAFGGVLFLAILLATLLRTSSPKGDPSIVPQPARHELVELNGQLDTLLAELETLENALAVQAETRERLTSPDLEHRYGHLQDLRRQRETLEKNTLVATQTTAREQREIDSIATRSEQLDKELAEANESALRSRGALEQEKRRQSQSVVPPWTRSTSKLECPLIVRYGRVYLKFRSGSTPFSREVDLDEFVILGEQDGRLRLTPKPLGGIAIDESVEFRDALLAKLAAHAPETWYLCLVVWDDSFDRFLDLKKRLIDAGYELRIIPMEQGGSVGESHVPDPQVQ